MNQAYRFELDPNNATRSRLSSHTGASRFAYNWGLALVKERLAQREQIRLACFKELMTDEDAALLVNKVEVPWNLYALRKEWNRQKHAVAPWWAENSKEAYNSGLDALARALNGFSKARRGERAGSIGFPRFKKAGGRKSCRFSTGVIKVVELRHVQLPRLGVIRTKEETTALVELIDRGRARILSATIKEEAGRWFVSFGCETERRDEPARFPDQVVGVDYGIKVLVALSNGMVYENPKALNRYQRKMAHIQRELSRRMKGSRRRAQTKAKLARCHHKVATTRHDAVHKLTTVLACTYASVVIEDLGVSGLSRSAKGTLDEPGRRVAQKSGLNRSILDAAPGEFRRQLSYKVLWHGGQLIVADRYFPSSKLCSSCGRVKATLSLSTRVYRCQCGLEIDRDLNAALNLAAYGRAVAGSDPETLNGRRGGNPRVRSELPVKRQDGTTSVNKTVIAASQESAA